MLGEEIVVGNIVGDLAHAVHVVREADELGLELRELVKRIDDHRGAKDLGKGADMDVNTMRP